MTYTGRRVHVIFPDRDVDLGIVGEDEIVVTGESATAGTSRLEAFKIHRDDPRAQKLVRAAHRATIETAARQLTPGSPELSEITSGWPAVDHSTSPVGNPP